MFKKMKMLNEFRYFVDSVGYMFVQMDDCFKGVILDEDGNFLSYLPSCAGRWASEILSEINPSCFTEEFITRVANGKIKVMKDIARDIIKQQNIPIESEKESIPKSVMEAVQERIALLPRKIPEYRYDVKAFIRDECEKYNVDCTNLKTEFVRKTMLKYPDIIRLMESELDELKKFARGNGQKVTKR